MKIMRIVLAAIHTYPSPQAIPLANAFLKSYLDNDPDMAEKVTVELCDFFVEQPVDDILSTILARNPDIVGFSIYLWNRIVSLELVAAIRKAKPQLLICAGGPEPTADPESLLRDSPFDFLILGEGEITFHAAISAYIGGKCLTGIDGTASMQSGKPVIFSRGGIEHLDSIPSPYLSGVIDPSSYEGVLWQLSRGCSFDCDYCFDSQGINSVRRFSMERIRAELLYFVQNKVSQVFVIDSTFNLDKIRAKEILRLIARHAPHIHFHFEVRSEFIDVEMARLFARINCSLQIGLQSAHPRVHKMVNRLFNPEQFSEKIGLLNHSGAIFGFDLIYGLPGDTLAGFLSSIDFALGHYPNHLDLFPLAVLPGTPLAAKAETLGVSYMTTPPYTLQSSPGFPVGKMEEAAGIALACDIFYSRGKAVAWFNSLLTPLKLSPSTFLHEFLVWLKATQGDTVKENDLSDHDIWQIQRDFIIKQYTKKKLRRLLPAALDQIDYHWHFASTLLAVPPELSAGLDEELIDPLDDPIILAQSTRLARFNHDISVMLQLGEIDLESFSASFKPLGSYAVIYPGKGTVSTEIISEPYFNFLGRLDGRSSPRQIAATLHFPLDEARTFLTFCISEGIVCRQ